jgi:DNA-binding XRE family transcriptional regulator
MRNNITTVRMEQNLSANALAKKAGVNQSTVSRVESGEVVPTVPIAIAICKALGRDFYEIFPDAKK